MGPHIDGEPLEYSIYNVSCIFDVYDEYEDRVQWLAHGTVRAKSAVLAEVILKQVVAIEIFREIHCVATNVLNISSYKMPDDLFKANALSGEGHKVNMSRVTFKDSK